jgi:hypothetical protein
MKNLYTEHKNPDLSHLREIDNPTIGLDFDGVLSSTREHFLNEIENMYNVKINRELHMGSNPVIPQIGKSFGTLIEEIVNHNTDIYSSIPPIKGCSEATNRLKEYYKIKIITHRVHDDWLDNEKLNEVKNLSINWLIDNDIYFDEFVCPTPENKSEIPANVYIDDRKGNIDNVLNKQKNNVGILYLKPHNITDFPWNAWLASSEKQLDIKYVANNDVTQWKIISDSLINCLD